MEKVILIALLMSLGGCGLFQKKQDTEVLIPVAERCKKAPEVTRPHLPIEDLKDTSAPDEIAMAYKLTVKKLQQWGLEQEALLDGYRTKVQK